MSPKLLAILLTSILVVGCGGENGPEVGGVQNVAETLFTSVSLNPEVRFSSALKEKSPSAELRGKNHSEIEDLIAAKNWRGLVSVLLKTTEYAPLTASDLQEAHSRLLSMTFPMLIKVSVPEPSQTYYAVSLQTFTFAQISEPHPDGIGYVMQWMPSMGDIIVVPSEPATKGWFSNSLEREKVRLVKKLELGELDQKEMRQALHDRRAQLATRVSKWAGVGETTSTPLRIAATAFQQQEWDQLVAALNSAVDRDPTDPLVQQAAKLAKHIVVTTKALEALPEKIRLAEEAYAKVKENGYSGPLVNGIASQEDVKKWMEAQVAARKPTYTLPMLETEYVMNINHAIRDMDSILHDLISY